MTRPRGRGTAWNVYELATLRDAYGRLDVSAIAAELGRTPEGVARKARALGLRAPAWGATLRGFAAAAGLSRATVQRVARDLGVRLERQVRVRSGVRAPSRSRCITPAIGRAIIAYVAANRRPSGRLPCKNRKETTT